MGGAYVDMEKLRAARRRYKTGAAGRAANRKYEMSAAGKAAPCRSDRKYAQKHPMKIYARRAVQRAIKRGLMTRKPCVICGATLTHAHHVDYSKPYDVTWLCHVHHVQEHRTEN